MVRVQDLIKPIKDDKELIIRESPSSLENVSNFIIINKISKTAYNVSLEYDKTKNLNINSNIRVVCNCDDFQFRWAYVLFTKDGLYNPHRLVLTPPVKTNPNQNIGCCKHISQILNEKLHNNIKMFSPRQGSI